MNVNTAHIKSILQSSYGILNMGIGIKDMGHTGSFFESDFFKSCLYECGILS